MAEFKTAEQYVVDRLVTTENELEELKITHDMEVGKLIQCIEETEQRLDDVLTLLNIFRDFISVRHDDYFGNCINVETIYGKSNPDEVELLMEYFDMRPEEDE